MTTKSKTTGVLPAHLTAAVPKVGDAERRVAEAEATRTAAHEAARMARIANEGAKAEEEAAYQAAAEANKPNPKPIQQRRRAEAEAAAKRLDAENVRLAGLADGLRAEIVEHRAELDQTQAPRVAEVGGKLVAALDTVADLCTELATEAGVWHGLHAVSPRRVSTPADERRRMAGREPSAQVPTFEPARTTAAEHIDALRAEVERLQTQPTPAPDRRAERDQTRRAKAERKRAEAEEQEQRAERRRSRAQAKDAA